MKKTLSFILGVVAIVALILGSAENPDGSCNLAWSITWLAVFAAAGWAWVKLNQQKKEGRK